MPSKNTLSRRTFIAVAGVAGTGLLGAGCSGGSGPGPTAVELLDRHHGLLHRAIAILEEIRGGMDARMDLPPEIIQGTVAVIRLYGIDYHQKMEEKYILPAFEAAKKMGALLGVLREQHAAGAQLTAILQKLASEFSAKDLEKRRTMGSAIHQFSRLCRAHSDHESTVLYPALYQVMKPKAIGDLNGAFRKSELEVLGHNGFEEGIKTLVNYENALGTGDLASFTPRIDELS
ncbi:MAG: hemerythrin domain-containing protein [Desulfobacteraceae bacterium]|nr:hemerythrin domain-containing protein [Desulfobacteraceae bacterium]